MSDRRKLRTLMAVLQEPLALVPRPFAFHAGRLGISEEQVIALIRKNLERGVIRRFAGVVKHDQAGYRYNAMVAFEVADGGCDKAGETLSKLRYVTHCYRRTSCTGWPYNLYAMMHARSRREFAKHIQEMTDAVPYRSMTVLRTVKEYKKTQFRLPVK